MFSSYPVRPVKTVMVPKCKKKYYSRQSFNLFIPKNHRNKLSFSWVQKCLILKLQENKLKLLHIYKQNCLKLEKRIPI
jgi:hypothetical protein